MYCTNCGKHNPEGSKFCKNCGNPLKISQLPKIAYRENTHLTILSIVAVVVVIVGMILFFLFKYYPSLIGMPTKSPHPLTNQQSIQMSKELSSGSESEIRSAVALPNGQPLDKNAMQQIASLGKITFDTSTFHDNHDSTATVAAQIMSPQGTKQSWIVHLIDIDSQWKISYTEPSL